MFTKQFTTTVLIVLVLFSFGTGGQTGTIQGIVRDASTLMPLPGANIIVQGTNQGAATNLEGRFYLSGLHPSIYTIEVRYMGYEIFNKTDIYVRPDRTFLIDVNMEPQAFEMESLLVTTDYFQKDVQESAVRTSFSSEEIRRSPGAAGDVSRVIGNLPSTGHSSDQTNDLVVRGGSPFENGYYVDNIMIPNINHFPTPGSSGGPIGLLNVDLIEEASFNPGGFSAVYGNRLSSVLDIKLRDGNPDEFNSQLDLSMSGAGFVIEGPISPDKASFILSVRRSFLDLISGQLNMGSMVPRYGDIHLKSNWDLSPQTRLHFLLIGGRSVVDQSPTAAADLGMTNFGEQNSSQLTYGFSLRQMWRSNGYTITALSRSKVNTVDEWYEASSSSPLTDSDYQIGTWRIRNVSLWKLNRMMSLRFGFESEIADLDLSSTSPQDFDRLGQPIPGTELQHSSREYRTSLFLSQNWVVNPKISLNTGVRTNYNRSNKTTTFEPRVQGRYELNETTSVRFAAGVYHQNLPEIIRVQRPAFNRLADPRADHILLGIDYLIQSDTKLSIDFYLKDYKNLPVELEDPSLFVLDDSRTMTQFRSYRTLEANGVARANGVEILLQKKLVEGLYGHLGTSIFQSRYQDLNGNWYERETSNRFTASLVGGYRPNESWDLSLKWAYAGGLPYTPFNAELSSEMGTGIIDLSRFLDSRYPDYHSLNIRLDNRRYMSWGTLISYVSIWNTYNNKNVTMLYWNDESNRPEFMYSWATVPMLGFELEL